MSKMRKTAKIEIVVHLLVWLLLFYIPVALSWGAGEKNFKDIALHFWLQLVFIAVLFYLNYLWLVEKFLFASTAKKVLYVVINIAVITLLIYSKSQIISAALSKPDGNMPRPPRQLIWYMDFLIYLIPVAFAIAIATSKKLTNMEVYKTEAENIKLQSDLVHLKFQLQPHFFFNSLNNIYSLIDTDPDKARQSIHSMSKLMRHLLQASDASTITLAEEIDFLKKYIALMQLRLGPLTHVEVQFPGDIPDIHISPLLFISLVENAFKHGVSARQETHIVFTMKASASSVVFSSRNTNLQKTDSDLSGSGIGLVNLRKRLSLLYPDKYQLDAGVANDEYIATLQISLA